MPAGFSTHIIAEQNKEDLDIQRFKGVPASEIKERLVTFDEAIKTDLNIEAIENVACTDMTSVSFTNRD